MVTRTAKHVQKVSVESHGMFIRMNLWRALGVPGSKRLLYGKRIVMNKALQRRAQTQGRFRRLAGTFDNKSLNMTDAPSTVGKIYTDCGTTQNSCKSQNEMLLSINSTNGLHPAEVRWDIFDQGNNALLTYGQGGCSKSWCFRRGALYSVVGRDYYGDGWQESVLTVRDVDDEVLFTWSGPTRSNGKNPVSNNFTIPC